MADLPGAHPSLTLHLTDASNTPIITSCETLTEHALATAWLQEASLSTYTYASQLGLGRPLRVVVETRNKGPVVAHSYIRPPTREREAHMSTRSGVQRTESENDSDVGGKADEEKARQSLDDSEVEDTGGIEPTGLELYNAQDGNNSEVEAELDLLQGMQVEEIDSTAQMLVATVIAPDIASSREARFALGRVELVAGEIQKSIDLARNKLSGQEDTLS